MTDPTSDTKNVVQIPNQTGRETTQELIKFQLYLSSVLFEGSQKTLNPTESGKAEQHLTDTSFFNTLLLSESTFHTRTLFWTEKQKWQHQPLWSGSNQFLWYVTLHATRKTSLAESWKILQQLEHFFKKVTKTRTDSDLLKDFHFRQTN